MKKLFLSVFLVLVLILFTFLKAEELEIYKYFREDGTTKYWTAQMMTKSSSVPNIGCVSVDDFNIWTSSWVLTIENEGDLRCVHDWVSEEKDWNIGYGCLVVHDERGCPDTWGEKRRICRNCLRKEIEQEKRYFSKRYLEDKKNKQSKKQEYRKLEKKVEELKK